MENQIKIFLSWSKTKSKELANATMNFIQKTLGNNIIFFYSPEIYKGSCVDNIIHENLITCDICIVCLTLENFKNPWLMYESGVVYGANVNKDEQGIVIPILFEKIPDWSSWIDKPLNRYKPIQMQDYNHEFSYGKKEFEIFLKVLSKRLNKKMINFNKNWTEYEMKVKDILLKNQQVPLECQYIFDILLKQSNDFIINSPEITKEKICFHQGFTTHALTKILINALVMDHNNILWIYGRKNKKIMSREYEPFFKYLADEGLKNNKDFRCLFPMPNSIATNKASSKDRAAIFDEELELSLRQAISLKYKYNLPIEKVFRLYLEPRTDSIIRLDNSVLHRKIVRDIEGYPLPYTNSAFEINSVSSENGKQLIESFEEIWENESKSVPLTEELFKRIYKLNE